jgi:catechol 2,3-dioxygenase-like lactoylglutathione lyase family enzyme
MIGYVTVGTNDLPRATAFYDALLAEVGASRVMEFGGRGHLWSIGMDKPGLCVMLPFDGKPACIGNGCMNALATSSKEQVDRLYAKALALGGSDEGAPGQRGPGFYAAYFRDPEGNKLNAFFLG